MNVLDQFNLSGKTALITGCRRGIGKSMAVGLAEAGADIVGVSASLETSGSAVEREVTALGRSFRGYACDVGAREELYEFIRRVKADVPQVDILVNNAGTILRAPAAEHPDEYWDKVIEVNLSAQFVLSREFGKDMITRGSNPAILARIPAGRWGHPDDFKGPVVFLASVASCYMHGTIMTVDGGWMGR